MHEHVNYDVKSGVVTLTGEVNSQSKRDRAEQVATSVPNVKQVVNDLQVKNQKASSSQEEFGMICHRARKRRRVHG
jgi:BON domain